MPTTARGVTARYDRGPRSAHDNVVAHTLTAEGSDASEDGTGRGVPLVVAIQDGARAGNKSQHGLGVRSDGAMFTLDTMGTHAIATQQMAYGVNENGRGETIFTEKVPALTAGGGKPGQGYAAVAVSLRGREGGATAEVGGEVASAQRARQGGGDKAHVLAPIALSARNLSTAEDKAYTVTSPGAGGSTDERVIAFAWQQGTSENDRSYPVRVGETAGALSTTRVDAVQSARWGVRRLTPTECARLQGFSDDHLDGESDSAKYRQLGNAVAVPVAEWLGRQIVRFWDYVEDE